MKTKVLESLASLKLAVVLLILLLIGLAIGTILESAQGTEVAGRLVYYSWWFLGLQGLFAANVVASLIEKFPWSRMRVGYALTHSSLVLILVGAGMTYFLKQEGSLMLWEGEMGNQIVNTDRDGHVLSRTTLPFAVKLDRFRIDHYPGTMRPAGFRSDVQIIDPAQGTFPAAVWMNHPLEHRGWTFFQSSYQQADGRSATVLSVSKDPGQNVVFVGYALLVLGMCVVLATRIVQAKHKAALEAMMAADAAQVAKPVAAVAALALLLLPGTAAAAPDWEALRRLPVQHDGRTMPFDTLAREAVWKVTGDRSWNGADPVETVAFWIADPQAAANAALVEPGGKELRNAAGLGAGKASFLQLVRNQAVLGLLDQAREAAQHGQPRQGALAAAEKLEERLVVLQGFLNRETLRPMPAADPNAQWGAPQGLGSVDGLVALATGPRLAGWPDKADIEREITYNAVRPTRIAWIVLTLALVLSVLAWSGTRKALDWLSAGGLVLGFAVMSWGIATRWQVAGRIPASNMYESLLFLAWGVGLFAVIAFAFMRNRLVVLNANAMAALTMALTDLLPIDGFIHPMPPVLSGTPWLAIHVPIIMVGYAVLALGVVIAHMQIGFGIFAPKRTEVISRMSDLLYWYTQVGSILLITGILTGSIWAASSWGRYWGWDPKEVWSLVAWLAYLAILHARHDKWIGSFGVAAFSIAAFQTILMTYLGVNFVLTTGMHSYGMGDSPVVTWMIIVALAETGFIGWGVLSQRRVAAPAPA